MDFTKILAAGLVVLLVTGGAAAGTGTGVDTSVATSETSSVTNADAYATYGNGTQYNESGQMSVGMSDARDIADAALAEPSQGNWTLVEADAHEEDNYYKFEYVLADADRPGEAEIRIHGSNGEVIEYEQDIEREDEQETEDEREDEDEQENEDD